MAITEQFVRSVFKPLERLARILPNGAQLDVRHMLVSGHHAVVELVSNATARNREAN